MIKLIIGGCRSGKSALALEQAARTRAERKIFLATCQPQDAEMRARVERHRETRDATWETIEEPIDIAAVIRLQSRPGTVILVDCLTLWLTNLVIGDRDDAAIQASIDSFRAALNDARGPVLLVANEVGLGIVPENALSRRFRDWAGSLNQQMARIAGEVTLSVAGVAVPIKTMTPEDHP